MLADCFPSRKTFILFEIFLFLTFFVFKWVNLHVGGASSAFEIDVRWFIQTKVQAFEK